MLPHRKACCCSWSALILLLLLRRNIQLHLQQPVASAQARPQQQSKAHYSKVAACRKASRERHMHQSMFYSSTMKEDI